MESLNKEEYKSSHNDEDYFQKYKISTNTKLLKDNNISFDNNTGLPHIPPKSKNIIKESLNIDDFFRCFNNLKYVNYYLIAAQIEHLSNEKETIFNQFEKESYSYKQELIERKLKVDFSKYFNIVLIDLKTNRIKSVFLYYTTDYKQSVLVVIKVEYNKDINKFNTITYSNFNENDFIENTNKCSNSQSNNKCVIF
jgi:hypothetical protein